MKFIRILTICFLGSLCAVVNINAETAAEDQVRTLNLEEVKAMALQANHKMHIAAIDVEASKHSKKEAFTEFLPKLKTEYGFTYSSEPNDVIFNNTRFIIATQDNYLWTTSAVQNIFNGLATLTGYQISDIKLQIANIRKAATRIAIILEAKKGYYAVQNAKLLVKVAMKSVKSLQDHLAVAKEYYNVGLTPKIDYLNSEVDLATAVQELETAKNRVIIAKAALSNIIDLPVDQPIDTAGTLTFIPFPLTYEECVDKAIELRPGLKDAHKNIRLAEKQIRLARSDYFPRITASINYNRTGDKWYVNGSDFEDRENWNVMLQGAWTFWEWGKTRQAVLRSKENLKKTVKEMNIVEDRIRFEVKEAYRNMKTAQNNIKVAEKSVASAEENLRISEERYKEQVAIITEVLDAETRLTRSRTFLTNALNDYNVAMATLYWAIGME